MHIVATKQHIGVHKGALHQPQNTISLRDTGDNTTHMVFKCESAVKLQAKNVKVGTSANGNPDKNNLPPFGWLTVLDLLTTKALVLLGLAPIIQKLSGVARRVHDRYKLPEASSLNLCYPILIKHNRKQSTIILILITIAIIL